MENMIKVLYKKPYGKIEEIEIKNDYKELQRLVDGWIEIVPMPGIEGIDIILDEEGILKDLDPNFDIYEYCDTIVGPVVIAGNDGYGETISLTPEQIKFAKKFILENAY